MHHGVHPPVVQAPLGLARVDVDRAAEVVLAAAAVRAGEGAEVLEALGAVALAAPVGAGHAHQREEAVRLLGRRGLGH